MIGSMNKPSFQIKKLELGPYGTNCYMLLCNTTKKAVIIDAPDNADIIMNELKGYKPVYIVITHNHGDHTGALIELKLKLNIPVAVHQLDADFLPCPSEVKLNEGDTVSAGNIVLKVLHTPGHTQGSICLLIAGYLFAGDTIFPGGPGHTITPSGLKQEIESIASKIMVLPDDTVIYPGHGDSSILGEEKKSFAVFKSKSHSPDLHGDVLWLSS
jgi:hydroxyacylglutathione hydrolase